MVLRPTKYARVLVTSLSREHAQVGVLRPVEVNVALSSVDRSQAPLAPEGKSVITLLAPTPEEIRGAKYRKED